MKLGLNISEEESETLPCLLLFKAIVIKGKFLFQAFFSIFQISTKREEEKSLRNKVSELERLKNQMIQELETKERMIQQFKKVCFV